MIFALLILMGLVYGVLHVTKDDSQPQPAPVASTTAATRSIEGGVAKTAGLVFDLYTLEAPKDWSLDREAGLASERVELTKGEYSLVIFQAATEGGLCLYPGDPDFPGPSARHDAFISLTTRDGRELRRGRSTLKRPSGKVSFTLCQPNREGEYALPTRYGHLSYSVPQEYDDNTLAEMDRIVSSLKAR